MKPSPSIHLALRDGQTVELSDPQGALLLVVTCEGGRTTVSLGTNELRVATQGDITLACQDFRVAATRAIDLDAPEVRINASVKGVLVRAHDVVTLLGERINLNTDHDPDATRAKAQAWVSKLLGR